MMTSAVLQHPISRTALAIACAVSVTLLVFWVMQSLITSGGSVQQHEQTERLANFVDLSQDDAAQTKQRQPKKPPQSIKPPPAPDLPKAAAQQRASMGNMHIGGIDIAADLSVDSGLAGASGDGEYLPIVKVAPQYPRRAAQRGIEGYVVVEFTVNKLGAVINPVVIEAEPAGIFNRAALNAAKKFKYKPKIVDGQAQEVSGIRNIIRFQLDKKS